MDETSLHSAFISGSTGHGGGEKYMWCRNEETSVEEA